MPTRLLAVDTCSEVCGVALAVDGEIKNELIVNQGGTHTKNVMDAVDALLRISRSSIDGMDAFAVTQGPGSFTGLRIGISTVKGLATAMDKPMVGISSLDMLAHQACGNTPLVCALMDARRNEVYWRVYRRSDQGLSPLTPEKVGPAVEVASHIQDACFMIGNGTREYRKTLEPLLKVKVTWARDGENGLRPSMLARLGWRKFERGDTLSADAFRPVYLRKSDAELNRRRLEG